MFSFKDAFYVCQKMYVIVNVFIDLLQHNQLNQLVQLATKLAMKHFGSILTYNYPKSQFDMWYTCLVN